MFPHIHALVLMSLFVLSKSHTKAHCTDYEFPDVIGKTITTSEHDVLNVTFRISNKCIGPKIKNFTTAVKKHIYPDEPQLLCMLQHSSGECHAFGDCECPGNNSTNYTISTRVERKDTGKWIWNTTTAHYWNIYSIDIVVTYDPSLTNLTFPSPIDQNAPVTIVCFWDNGYPPNNSVPEMFDRRGKRFSVKTLSPETHVSYTIDSVQCGDAGEIVCKNSTGGRLSKTLLVRCGPSFQKFTDPPVYNVNSGSDLLLEFAVRSHSKEIHLCKFQNGISPSKPCSNEKLTGLPPDLMFYASFPDVSPSDIGLQTLTLINDAGSGQVDFLIGVIDQDTNFAKTPFGIFVIVVNAGIVAAITFRVIVKRRQCVTLLCGRPAADGNAPVQMQRYPDRCLPLQGQQRERQGEGQPAANRRSTDTSSSNTYESVSDGEVSTVGGSHLCVANTENDSTEDEYYLHPVASSEDLHELGAQPLE